jgi:beta-galactosidase
LIDEGWRFSLNDTAGADAAAFDDSRWRVVDLPHDWSIEHSFVQDALTGGGGGYLPTGVGWYRKHLAFPTALKGRVAWIEFEGVYQNSDVWVNGHHLGHYPNGYMSFVYELTNYIKQGDNIIAVRVDNSRQPNTRYYSGSGIYRHVWLTTAGPVHIPEWGTYVTCPEVDPVRALVLIRTKIQDNRSGAQKGVQKGAETGLILRSTLLGPNGKEVVQMESAIGDSAELEQKISLSSPKVWSLEDPILYSLRSEIVSGGKTLDETSTPFGIRMIRYSADSGFFLNDKHVKMNGVCLHHDAGSVGSAVPEAVWARRLQVLKEMGCNAIRSSHGPVAPAFLDLCDRMGFLVMDEFLDEWKSAKVKYGYSNYFDEWSQKDLESFICRDRNHPSIIMWSAGNEIGEQKQPNGVDVLRPLIEAFHREDPTRPVTTGNDDIAADNGSATLPFLNMLDIVGYNYVDRWHERRELFYSIDRHDHPGWKMVGTESVSIPGVRGNYYGGNFNGRSFQIDSSVVRSVNMPALIRVEQLWKFVYTHDYVIGDFMWTGIDYLGEARWPARSASSGVIDLCGFPKDAFYFYQSRWTEKPMIHLFPHWNWKGKEGQIIPVLVYTNCDTVELSVNGKSWGLKALEFPRQGNSGSWNRYKNPPVYATTGDLHLSWDVPYTPGVLRVVGRKGGRVACEEEVRTTGEPAAIRLSADRDSIGSERDVAQVRIEVTDANGLVVPDASSSVKLSVEGGGKLIGFDNGNPTEHESMKSEHRNVFNGLALATVQSGGHAGRVVLHATSPGLRNADLVLVLR